MGSTSSGWSPKTGFKPGTVIADRYAVVSRLGSGGMGTVLKVQDTKLENQIIALKLLNPQIVDVDPTAIRRLANEVVVARTLTHPNIVRIHDIGETDDGFSYISMEYVQGVGLDRIVRRYTQQILDTEATSVFSETVDSKSTHQVGMPFPYCYRILCEVVKGIAYAHGKGVIHRDLKPANILISDEGEIKIVDFGLARMCSAEMGLTRTGETVGTPSFMAPEQFRGEKVDARADIYALSIIGYQMVTGALPFSSTTYVDLALKHMNEPMPDLLEHSPEVPAWFRDMVVKAGAKKRDNRYQSAEELLEELLSHAESVGRETVRAGKIGKLGNEEDASEYRLFSRSPWRNSPPTDVLRSEIRSRFQSSSWIAAGCLLFVLLVLGFSSIGSDSVEPSGVRSSAPVSTASKQQAAPSPGIGLGKEHTVIPAESASLTNPEHSLVLAKNNPGKEKKPAEMLGVETSESQVNVEDSLPDGKTPEPQSLETSDSPEKDSVRDAVQVAKTVLPVRTLRRQLRPRRMQPPARNTSKAVREEDLLSGSYKLFEGSYTYFRRPRQERTLSLNISFKNGQIVGEAIVDVIGTFSVSGSINEKNGIEMTLTGKHNQLILSGRRELDKLRGTIIGPRGADGKWEVELSQ